EGFRIGAMVSLWDLETHKGLAEYTQGAMKESLRHIVGVQFRNCATVGGSIYVRFGFSDVLTMFLAMDSYVELYKGGIIPLEEFSQMKRDRDILVRILVKKRPAAMSYISQRNSSTDFPILACGVSLFEDGEARVTLGACTYKPVLVKDENEILKDFLKKEPGEQKEDAESFAAYAREHVRTGTNMRAYAQYRSHLVQVLTKRALIQAGGKIGRASCRRTGKTRA